METNENNNEQMKNEVLDNESSLDTENVQLFIHHEKEEKEEKGPTFTTVDLKNMINEELASVRL